MVNSFKTPCQDAGWKAAHLGSFYSAPGTRVSPPLTSRAGSSRMHISSVGELQPTKHQRLGPQPRISGQGCSAIIPQVISCAAGVETLWARRKRRAAHQPRHVGGGGPPWHSCRTWHYRRSHTGTLKRSILGSDVVTLPSLKIMLAATKSMFWKEQVRKTQRPVRGYGVVQASGGEDHHRSSAKGS